MTKTPAEFLEELKKDLNHYRRHYSNRYKLRITFEELVTKIAQFQAEQKQVSDDNLNI